MKRWSLYRHSKSIGPSADREEAIIGVLEERTDVETDADTNEAEMTVAAAQAVHVRRRLKCNPLVC